jgi:hypothetical protein
MSYRKHSTFQLHIRNQPHRRDHLNPDAMARVVHAMFALLLANATKGKSRQ